METLIYVIIIGFLALVAGIVLIGVVGYFVHGDTKEEVISNIKTLITGEELE